MSVSELFLDNNDYVRHASRQSLPEIEFSMVFIPPPHLASASRPSYAETYNNILAVHRRSPLSAASSVIILVAPDADALCAAKMLAELFKQDDVMHRITPLSGIADLERVRDELITYSEVCHVVIFICLMLIDA
jgi:cell division control protein 45